MAASKKLVTRTTQQSTKDTSAEQPSSQLIRNPNSKDSREASQYILSQSNYKSVSTLNTNDDEESKPSSPRLMSFDESDDDEVLSKNRSKASKLVPTPESSNTGIEKNSNVSNKKSIKAKADLNRNLSRPFYIVIGFMAVIFLAVLGLMAWWYPTTFLCYQLLEFSYDIKKNC